jgi:hypothetical protein
MSVQRTPRRLRVAVRIAVGVSLAIAGTVAVLGTLLVGQCGFAGGSCTYERDPLFWDESLRFNALGCAAVAGGVLMCTGRFTWRRVAAVAVFGAAGGVIGWLAS